MKHKKNKVNSVLIDRERVYIEEYIANYYTQHQALSLPIMKECVEYSHLSGGKRYRALMCILFSQYLGVERENIMPFAVAIEMIHTYSLIHDDLPALDNDSFRRGKKAHHIYFGEAKAILSGDALLTDAFYAMTLTKAEAPLVVQAIQEIASASGSNGMVGGQMLDILSNTTPHSVERIHALKTGAIIQSSCKVSGILSNSSSIIQEELAIFGNIFGLLFQIIDDILDEVGTQSSLGKSVGKDKKQGKQTAIIEHGLEGAKDIAQKYVDECIASVLRIHSIHKGNIEYIDALTDIVFSVYNQIGTVYE